MKSGVEVIKLSLRPIFQPMHEQSECCISCTFVFPVLHFRISWEAIRIVQVIFLINL